MPRLTQISCSSAAVRPLRTASSRMATKPRREAWTVSGKETEVLHLPAFQSPAVHLLIVPGNPGQAGYYWPFMQSLHSLLSGSASVTAVSHLGMGSCSRTVLTPTDKVVGYTLEEQIDHKVALLREHLLGEGRAPVVILAHSIGTYMAIHAVHRLEYHESIAKVVGLFPFLTVNPDSRSQARISRLASLHSPMATLASVLQRLPSTMRRRLLDLFAPELENHAAETALQLFSPSRLQNALYLATHEFQTLTAPIDYWLLRALGQRFAMVGCQNDVWCPDYKWDSLRQEVAEAWLEDGQSHAFCVSAVQSHEVAKRVVHILENSNIEGLNKMSKL